MQAILRFFRKPFRWAALYSAFLICSSAFVLLNTFAIPRIIASVQIANVQAASEDISIFQTGPDISDTSYNDDNISVNIETVRKFNTTIHVAEITLKYSSLLKTAFANNRYGRNIRETTSGMAEEHSAILAINGDYYGFRNDGHVLRNGTLYRNTGSAEALVMDREGNFRCVDETAISAADIAAAWQIWSFGPALVKHGQIAVDSGSEISGRSAPSNPRTAIGQAGPLRYIMIVSNGRTGEDQGLSLHQLAEVFAERGCTVAYNLDGGGSSCMVFNGKVLSRPTTTGRNISEREVSDIVYIGYH
jgi:exopolysaccharide biosynthesis protein